MKRMQQNSTDESLVNNLQTEAMKQRRLVRSYLKHSCALLTLLILGIGGAWGQQPLLSKTYIFKDITWGVTPIGDSWLSGEGGADFTDGRGIQIDDLHTGAYGTSPQRFTHIKKVEVVYSTRYATGTGTINVFSVDATNAAAQSGTRIGNSESVIVGADGTVDKVMTFETTTSLNGYIQVYVTCTVPSIFIKSVTVEYMDPWAYTVTLNAGTGSVTPGSITETGVGSGITLPSATPPATCATLGWDFLGWSKTVVAETTTAPAYIPVGLYYPSNDETLHAVYARDGIMFNTNPRCVLPVLSVEPQSLTFTSCVARPSETQTITISGSNLLGVISYVFANNNDAFSIDSTGWSNVSGGTFKITFTPAAVALYNDTITFSTPYAENIEVALSGTGVVMPSITIADFPATVTCDTTNGLFTMNQQAGCYVGSANTQLVFHFADASVIPLLNFTYFDKDMNDWHTIDLATRQSAGAAGDIFLWWRAFTMKDEVFRCYFTAKPEANTENVTVSWSLVTVTGTSPDGYTIVGDAWATTGDYIFAINNLEGVNISSTLPAALKCDWTEYTVTTDQTGCKEGSMVLATATFANAAQAALVAVEYFETDPTINNWRPLPFTNGTATFGPATGFPFTAGAVSLFRAKSLSEAAVANVTLAIAIVRASDQAVIISEDFTTSLPAPPEGTISGDVTVCIGSDATYSLVTTSTGLTYAWTVTGATNTIADAAAATPVVTWNESGTLSVVFTDANACQGTASIAVSARVMPSITIADFPATVTCDTTNGLFTMDQQAGCYVGSENTQLVFHFADASVIPLLNFTYFDKDLNAWYTIDLATRHSAGAAGDIFLWWRAFTMKDEVFRCYFTAKPEANTESVTVSWSLVTVTGTSPDGYTIVGDAWATTGDYTFAINNLEGVNISSTLPATLKCDWTEYTVTTDQTGCKEGSMVLAKATFTDAAQAALVAVEYFETDPAINNWRPLPFTNGTATFGPATGFPFTAGAVSLFRAKSLSEAAVANVTLAIAIVRASDQAVIISENFTTSLPAPPEGTIVGDTIVCVGSDATYSLVTTSTGLTYAWTVTGATNTIDDAAAATPVVTWNESGTLSVVFTDANACQGTASIAVSARVMPSITIADFPATVTCDTTNGLFTMDQQAGCYVGSENTQLVFHFADASVIPLLNFTYFDKDMNDWHTIDLATRQSAGAAGNIFLWWRAFTMKDEVFRCYFTAKPEANTESVTVSWSLVTVTGTSPDGYTIVGDAWATTGDYTFAINNLEGVDISSTLPATLTCDWTEYTVTTDQTGCKEGSMVLAKATFTDAAQAALVAVEYFETDPAINNWRPLPFTNGTATFGPATGFPFTAGAVSLFRAKSLSEAAVANVTLAIAIVRASDQAVIISENFTTSLLAAPQTPEIMMTPESGVICGTSPVTLTVDSIEGATYTWYKGGVAIADEISNQLVVDEVGDYAVQVAVGDCISNLSESVTVTQDPDCKVNVVGTVFPFVYTGTEAFDTKFEFTVSLKEYPAINASTEDILNLLKGSETLYVATTGRYTGVAPFIEGTPKQPGYIGGTDNKGAHITWSEGVPPYEFNLPNDTLAEGEMPERPIGYFSFENVPGGIYILEIKRQGFITRWVKVTINPANTNLGHRELMFGDIDLDYQITTVDVNLVKASLTNYKSDINAATYPYPCDFDGSKTVNTTDVHLVRKKVTATIENYDDTKELLEALGIKLSDL